MDKFRVLAAGVSAILLIGAVPPKNGAKEPAPIANYWMDVSTSSGFGAGMMGGGKPSASQIMAMMNGGGASVAHLLSLKLSSREKPGGALQATHFIPAGMDMGQSLPLVSPQVMKAETAPSTDVPPAYDKPKGRMLIYWGCGEHVAAGAPMVIDLGKVAQGEIPPGLQALARMGRAMGRNAGREPSADTSAAFGEWPNIQDMRQVPADASLVGAHRIEANYAPQMAFSLGQGQDFMPGLALHEAGGLPSGAERLAWTPAAAATGYALALFGASATGDVVIWTSARSASLTPSFDFQTPSEVHQLVLSGAALSPATAECLLPSEVARAVPSGLVMEIGYGPQAFFSDSPRAPKWTARVRYKTSAMLMRGIGNANAYGSNDQRSDQANQPPPAQPKKRHVGIGDLLGAIPH